MNDKYMKVIEMLGEVLINKQIDIDLLKYENDKLKRKLDAVEQYVETYNTKCENTSNT